MLEEVLLEKSGVHIFEFIYGNKSICKNSVPTEISECLTEMIIAQ